MDTLPDFLKATIPSSLTCIACVILIVQYIRYPKKNLGFSLITILAVSDLIFASNTLVSVFYPSPSLMKISLGIMFFSIYFSIAWASAIAFLVYQSLADKNFDSKKQFIRTLICVFFTACLCSAYWDSNAGESLAAFISLFLPLALSLIFTVLFYVKSILILRSQQEYNLKSTKSYIRSLTLYSFVQLITYGPLIIYLFLCGFIYFDDKVSILMAEITENLAGLSGFFSAMIFLCRTSSDYRKPLIHENDNDLTQDMI